MIRVLFLTLCLCITLGLNAQVVPEPLNAQQTKNANRLIALMDELKEMPTPIIRMHSEAGISNDEEYYNKVIDRYFDRKKLIRHFSKDTSHFAVEGKFDIIRHLLNSLDVFLDKVPIDKIELTPYVPTNESPVYKDALVLTFIFGELRYRFLAIGFENGNSVLSGLSAFSISDPKLIQYFKENFTAVE